MNVPNSVNVVDDLQGTVTLHGAHGILRITLHISSYYIRVRECDKQGRRRRVERENWLE